MGYFSCAPVASVQEESGKIEWEETNCLLCRSRNWSLLLEAPAYGPDGPGLWFAVVQCQRCGLCFTNPRPSVNSIARFYPENYWPHREIDACQLSPRLGHRRRRRDRRHGVPWHGEGRLLDFGCGSGSFLARMHHQGWKVTGIDMSSRAVHRLRRSFGLPVLLGTLPHPELERESFDVITMRQSLEHVHNPLDALRQAFRLLVPRGKLLVIVPNVDSLPFRWFGPAWYGLDLPRHLVHFSPTTLQVMLEQAGFRVGPVRMVRHSHWLRSSARLAVRHYARPSWRRWLVLKPLSRLVTWYSAMVSQADCISVVATRSNQ